MKVSLTTVLSLVRFLCHLGLVFTPAMRQGGKSSPVGLGAFAFPALDSPSRSKDMLRSPASTSPTTLGKKDGLKPCRKSPKNALHESRDVPRFQTRHRRLKWCSDGITCHTPLYPSPFFVGTVPVNYAFRFNGPVIPASDLTILQSHSCWPGGRSHQQNVFQRSEADVRRPIGWKCYELPFERGKTLAMQDILAPSEAQPHSHAAPVMVFNERTEGTRNWLSAQIRCVGCRCKAMRKRMKTEKGLRANSTVAIPVLAFLAQLAYLRPQNCPFRRLGC